jgi:hypothetical protein
MKAATQLKEFAQLSEAASARLNASPYGNDADAKTALQNSRNGAFAELQSEDFVARYRVIHQFRDEFRGRVGRV